MRKYAPRGPVKAREGAQPLEVDTLSTAKKCRAHSSRTGKPCQRWAIAGGTVCPMHGGSAPQVKQSAQERLRAMQHPALDAMDWLIKQRDFPSAAYSAARDVLDRTEGKPAETVAMEHSGGIVIRHEGLE